MRKNKDEEIRPDESLYNSNDNPPHINVESNFCEASQTNE